MTKPQRRAYYVTARDGSNQRTAWLCGPFETHMAALRMVPAVTRAAVHHSGDPRMSFAAYGTASIPWEKRKPGHLPLQLLTLPDVWPLIAAPRIV